MPVLLIIDMRVVPEEEQPSLFDCDRYLGVASLFNFHDVLRNNPHFLIGTDA